MTSLLLNQVNFRGRYDNGSETAAGWIANVDTNFSFNAETVFRIRIAVAETNSRAATYGYKLYRSLGGGTYTEVTPSSAVVQLVSSSYVTHDDLTTQQISSGTFVQGRINTTGTTSNVALNNSRTEIEYVIKIVGADVATGNTIDLRAYRSDDAALNTYTVTPRVTVATVPPPDRNVNKTDSIALTENRSLSLSASNVTKTESIGITENAVVSIEAAPSFTRAMVTWLEFEAPFSTTSVDLSFSKSDGLTVTENAVVFIESDEEDRDVSGHEDVAVEEEVAYYPDEIIVSDIVTVEVEGTQDAVVVSDTIPVGDDTIVALSIANIPVQDSVSLAENAVTFLAEAGAISVNVTDSITLTEFTQSVTSNPQVNKSESIGISEFRNLIISDLAVNKSDSVSVTDTASIVVSTLTVSKQEAITVAEERSASVSNGQANVADSITVSENRTVSLEAAGEINVSASDTVTINEYTQFYLLVRFYSSQSITVSDSPSSYISVETTVQDTVLITDTVNVTHSNLLAYSPEAILVEEGVNIVLPEVGAITLISDDSITVSDENTVFLHDSAITVYDNVLVEEYSEAELETPVGPTLSIWIDPATIWQQGVKIWP